MILLIGHHGRSCWVTLGSTYTDGAIAAFNRCGCDVSYREGVDFTRCEFAVLASGFRGRFRTTKGMLTWGGGLTWRSRRLFPVVAWGCLGNAYT